MMHNVETQNIASLTHTPIKRNILRLYGAILDKPDKIWHNLASSEIMYMLIYNHYTG